MPRCALQTGRAGFEVGDAGSHNLSLEVPAWVWWGAWSCQDQRHCPGGCAVLASCHHEAMLGQAAFKNGGSPKGCVVEASWGSDMLLAFFRTATGWASSRRAQKAAVSRSIQSLRCSVSSSAGPVWWTPGVVLQVS